MTDNYFNELSSINVNNNTDKKGKFTYLSWAFAWGELKKKYPDASFQVERFDNGVPYLANELGYMVFTSVTVNDITHEMWLPVMDFRNQAIKPGSATMMEINKTIMRCLVKNIGMHGLGLYIYAGEDLPEEDDGKRAVHTPPNVDNKKYQDLVVKLFEQMVAEHGGNDKVYKLLGTDRTKYIESYTKNPKQLLETMQEYVE